MKILLTAATEKEIAPFVFALEREKPIHFKIDVLISGVGMVNTTFHLTKCLLQTDYDWVVNAGIGGTFCKDIALGTVLNVTEERFSELGVDVENGFEPFVENGFFKNEEIVFNNPEQKFFHPAIDELKRVNGITVNTVNGNPDKILQTKNMFAPCVESMEGAAVFYVCKKLNKRFVQLRSISNYVEKRNPDNWDIPLAIHNLNEFLIRVFL